MAAHASQSSRSSLSAFLAHHRLSKSQRETQSTHPHESSRSPSSMSCNPHCQPGMTADPITISSDMTAEGSIGSPTVKNPKDSVVARLRADLLQTESRFTARPRSWLFFRRPSIRSQPTRSKSVQLHKRSRSRNTSGSMISAPVLTCTTNAKVARTEILACENIARHDTPRPGQGQHVQTIEDGVQDEIHAPTRGIRLLQWIGLKDSSEQRSQSLMMNRKLCTNMTSMDDGDHDVSVIEKGITRRRTETMNLCRKKINKLTGHGHIRRKSVNYNTRKFNAENTGNDLSQSPLLEKPLAQDNQPILADSSSDLLFGSLSRSFAEAIDYLDIDAPKEDTMGFVKSKSSIFSLRKKTKNIDDNNEGNPASSRKELTVKEALKYLQPPDKAVYSKLKGAHPDPAVFSAASNDYVPAPPAPGYPRGANPLRMHTNTMDFAIAPGHITDLPKPPKHTPTLEEVLQAQEDDEEDEDAIDDAPIYSPSSGNLSQYARHSPSSAQHIVEADDSPEASTPVQGSAEKGYLQRLGLRSSQSGMNLLNRFSRANRDQFKTTQAHDDGRKMRKSKSVYFSRLLGKGDTSKAHDPLPQDAPSTPFRPVNPTPLRQRALYTGDESPERTPAQPEVQRRTPPRGSTTPLERAKRRGIIGMPSERIAEIIEQDSE